MKEESWISVLRVLVAETLFRFRNGPVRTWRWIEDRMQDERLDRQFGIYSSPRRSSKELGFNSPDMVPYQAVSFRDLEEIFAHVGVSSEDVLLDLGSGMGRVLCFAAVAYRLRRVIGLEISPELCDIARRNVERLRSRLKCSEVQIVNADAAEYRIPDSVSIVYFFNPFGGLVLRQALENIAASLRRSPRQIRILFYGTFSSLEFYKEAARHSWLTLQSRRVLSTGARLLSYIATDSGTGVPSGSENPSKGGYIIRPGDPVRDSYHDEG